jgi:hypothetical protein
VKVNIKPVSHEHFTLLYAALCYTFSPAAKNKSGKQHCPYHFQAATYPEVRSNLILQVTLRNFQASVQGKKISSKRN